MADTIGVGLVGANPDTSWAAFAHLPALAALPDYELRAVSTSRAESAAAAAAAYGVAGYDNHHDLIAHPGVDLVVVSVKASGHREPVTDALAAGKHVYCEWPLGKSLDETVELAELARAADVRTVIGLQARTSPPINYARDLIAQGYVGRVLSSSIVGTCWVYGATINANNAYMVIDTSHGVNALTIQMGHLADAIAYCLGEWEEISASTATVRPEVTVVESGDRIGVSTPDQVLLNGTLSGGVPVSVHLRGGATRGSTNLLWEINGTEGDLLISGGNVHVSTEDGGALELHGGRGDDAELAPLAIPESYRIVGADVPEGPPRNVARLYTQFAADLRDGTAVTPSFEHALFRYRTVDAIEEAVRSGLRQTIAVPLAG